MLKINVYIPDEMYKQIEEIAKQRRKKISDVVRSLLAEALGWTSKR